MCPLDHTGLVCCSPHYASLHAGYRNITVNTSFYVPHDIAAPIAGSITGPLAGLTAAVKDLYDIAGTRTGGGSPEWLAAQAPARAHAAAVEKILAAGATVTGKTICDEFFFSGSGINAHYGTPVNVRAPGRIPGGSSSGSAAAVAADACDFALGSDTGGSVRMPASYCGTYGLRPTHGRIDLSGAMAMAPSFDVGGFFANAPGVMRRVGSVLLDSAKVAAPVSRLIVAQDAFAVADAEVAALGRDFLGRASRMLPRPSEGTLAPDGFDGWREAFRIVQGREVWAVYGDFITHVRPSLGPGIKERMAFAATVTQAQADAASEIVAAARAHLRGLIAPGTIVALPTAPCIAPRIDMSAEESEQFRVRVMRLGCASVLAGLPQISIPAGTVAGCPAGLSFIGWAGGDEALLDLACDVAKHCGVVM
jgi:amidase